VNRAAVLLLIIIIAFLSWGCARTVTQIIQFGSDVIVQVELRGNLDMVNNKYYMIIGTSETYLLPEYPYEFVEPRQPTTDPTYNPYVYYRTWKAYIVNDDSGNYFLVPGPFNNTGEVYSRIPIGSITGAAPNRMEFRFRLDQLYGSSVPAIMYFDFVTTGPDKFLEDHLQPPSKYLDTYRGSEIIGTDDVRADINASLDILSWKVRVE
jgi:hypothetical protein